MPSRRQTKRDTIVGYVAIAAHQMARAILASVKCEELTKAETDAIIAEARSLAKLTNSLSGGKKHG